MTKQPINQYFAAANGYSGFRSYFNQIFDRKNFERVYIIKGGPGTGKSTLMKKILKEFEDVAYTEKIYCSSDTNSLDGIIIEQNGKRIAIIDGTSPHEEDARIPGAIDEIVNLGEAWNEKALENEKENILSLTESKKSSYKTAYAFLEIAGNIFKKKAELINKAYLGNDEHTIIDLISSSHKKNQGRTKDLKLISSFSKDGCKRLSTDVKDVISVVGNHGTEYVFLKNLYSYIASANIDYTLLPSPLSDDIIEGIFLPASERLIICGDGGGRVINTLRFIDDNVMNEYSATISLLEEVEEKMLIASKNALLEASIAHFKMEKIYSSAMDFEIHDKICASIINEIKIKLR